MSLTSFLLSALSLLLAGTLPTKGIGNLDYEVELDPKEIARKNVSVIADLPLPESHADVEDLFCYIVDPEGFRPGWRTQVERIDKEGATFARVYWVQPELRSGQRKTYRLVLKSEPNDRNETGFHFDHGNGYRNLHYGDRAVYRHMNAYDPDRHEETFKTFHHIYHFDGDGFITKGHGGLYSHHRGLFLGWNRTRSGDDSWDFWYGPNQETQRHREYLSEREITGPVVGRTASRTDWKDPEERILVTDTREVTAWWIDEDTLILDFAIELTAATGDVHLGGDAHHAGFQFRASQEVAENQETTAFIHPESAVSLSNDIWEDAPWFVGLFTVNRHRYSVFHADHPSNPGPTHYSTRNYGRFGAFFTADLEEETPLTLRYRILIKRASKTEDTSHDYFARIYRDFVEPVGVTVTVQEP